MGFDFCVLCDVIRHSVKVFGGGGGGGGDLLSRGGHSGCGGYGGDIWMASSSLWSSTIVTVPLGGGWPGVLRKVR